MPKSDTSLKKKGKGEKKKKVSTKKRKAVSDAESDSKSKKRVKKQSPKPKKNSKISKNAKKIKADADVVRRSPRLAAIVTPNAVEHLELKNGQEGKDEHGNPPLSQFPISQRSRNLLEKRGITHLFPIQASTFGIISEGFDVLGRARTGTGKTLAFTLPVVEKLEASSSAGRLPRVIVLTPTRELAKQVAQDFICLEKLKTMVVYGGASYGPQETSMRRGVDVVVGTCGRVKDHLERGNLKLDNIKVTILDETDEMLNMGFAEDVETILNYIPSERKEEVQTLLFSATVPKWVKGVSEKYLRKDKKVIDLVGDSKQKASTNVEHLLIFCHWNERNEVLNDVITAYAGLDGRVICFTETKKEANEMVMSEHIKYDCQALHGDIPQSQRETTVAGFKKGTFRVLVATDVAARGLDITGVSLVIQIEPPQSYETYVHRSGRTGRANTKGVSVLFYTAKQRWYVEQIERNASIKFRRVGPPNTAQLIKSSIGLLDEKLDAVSDKIVPLFKDKARELLKGDGEESLARALALIAGHTKPISRRSVMSAAKGYITVSVRGTQQIRSLTYVWNTIRKYLFDNPDDKVRAVKLTKDRMGAVFEVPERFEKQILDAAKSQSYFEFTIPDELPELEEREAVRPDPPRWRKGGKGFRGSPRGRRGGARGRGRRGGRSSRRSGRRGRGRSNRRTTF